MKVFVMQGVGKLINALQARGKAVYLISGGFRWLKLLLEKHATNETVSFQQHVNHPDHPE